MTVGNYDLVHVCSPGPAGCAALMLARVLGLPVIGSYHTELAAYAALRSGRPEVEGFAQIALGAFYGACDVSLSPSPASDARLGELGVPAERLMRWDRGVDLERFHPGLSEPGLLPGEINVLYAGRLTREKGMELLADAFMEAQRRDPRLHLVLAGGGPEEQLLRDRLGSHGTLLGWLSDEALARAYASADVFMFASQTDTFGQVILEAQASGLPVVAVGEGGPASLIEHGQSGLLSTADPSSLADAVLSVMARGRVRDRLKRGGIAAARERSWEAATRRLAAGYRAALAGGGAARRRGVA